MPRPLKPARPGTAPTGEIDDLTGIQLVTVACVFIIGTVRHDQSSASASLAKVNIIDDLLWARTIVLLGIINHRLYDLFSASFSARFTIADH